MNKIVLMVFSLSIGQVFSQINVGVIDGHAIDERYAVINGGMPESVRHDIMESTDSIRMMPIEQKNKLTSGIYPRPIELTDDAKWQMKVWRTIPINRLNESLTKGDRRIHITKTGDDYLIDTLYANYSIGLLSLLKKKILKDPSWFTYYSSVNFYHQSVLPQDTVIKIVKEHWDDLSHIQMKEYWYYDKGMGELKSKTIGISFYYQKGASSKCLFTMYYPELFWYIHNLTIDGYYDEHHMWNDVFENHLLVSNIDSVESTSVFQFLRTGFDNINELPNSYHLEAYFYQIHFKELVSYYMDSLPFNDEVNFETYDGGKVRGRIRNGLMDGEWQLTTKEGQVHVKLNYSHGKANGLSKIYHSNGALKNTGSFDHGLKSGKWNSYTDQGIKSSEYLYNNGWLDQEQKAWYPNGQLYLKYRFNEFKIDGTFERFWANGDLMEKGNMQFGYREGEWEFHLNLSDTLERMLGKPSDEVKKLHYGYLYDLISDSKIHMTINHVLSHKRGAFENLHVEWLKGK